MLVIHFFPNRDVAKRVLVDFTCLGERSAAKLVQVCTDQKNYIERIRGLRPDIVLGLNHVPPGDQIAVRAILRIVIIAQEK